MHTLAKIDAATWGFLGVTCTSVLALVGTLLTQQRTRRDNRADHGTVRDALTDLRTDIVGLRGDVRDVRDAQHQHMRWHLERDHTQSGDGR